MREFLKKEFGSDCSIIIKLIEKKSKYTDEHYNCFKLGIRESDKEKIYDPKHWPRNIIAKPFEFFRRRSRTNPKQ